MHDAVLYEIRPTCPRQARGRAYDRSSAWTGPVARLRTRHGAALGHAPRSRLQPLWPKTCRIARSPQSLACRKAPCAMSSAAPIRKLGIASKAKLIVPFAQNATAIGRPHGGKEASSGPPPHQEVTFVPIPAVQTSPWHRDMSPYKRRCDSPTMHRNDGTDIAASSCPTEFVR